MKHKAGWQQAGDEWPWIAALACPCCAEGADRCSKEEGGCGKEEGGCGKEEGGCGKEEGGCGKEEGGCGKEVAAMRTVAAWRRPSCISVGDIAGPGTCTVKEAELVETVWLMPLPPGCGIDAP